MTNAAWIAYLVLCLSVELTPGPNMAYLAIVSAKSGRKAGFAAVAGVASGLALVGSIAALGVAEVIRAVPLLDHALIFSGAAYLLWLAWQSWHEGEEVSPDAIKAYPVRRGVYYRRGLITNLLNPKAFVFYATILPGFLGDAEPVMLHALLLTAISVLIATMIHALIVMLAASLNLYLADAARQRLTRRIMALLLVAVAIWFVAANVDVVFKEVV